MTLTPGTLWLLACAGLACAGQVGDGPGPRPAGPGSGAGGVAAPGGPGAGAIAGPGANPVCAPGPGGAPALRRLTRFEYNNTVRDLLGDTSAPANALPAEELGNGFGNDAAGQSVSSLLAEQYAAVAEGIASRALQAPTGLAPCAGSVSASSEEACARTIIEGLAPRAFRRSLVAGEADELLGLFRTLRALPGAGFAPALAGVIEALLQSPHFLYRIEERRPGGPSGDELATRLSYLLWGTMPDQGLRAAARAGELQTAQGVAGQARRLLADPRARVMVRFFFDNLLPLAGLSDLERDPAQHPTFSPAIGSLMREETQRLLEYEIFEGAGSWSAALTAPHTFVNGPLAAFYKLPGVQGSAFRKVPLDVSKRLGILTQASVMAGTTHSNHTNPVVRGSFVAQKLLCRAIPLPDASIADQVKPPDPYSGKTARERFTRHQADPVCRSCHLLMDPLGLALENFDAVGLHRTHENGVLIDAQGALPGGVGTVDGPVQLARALAAADATHDCFASQWLALALGKNLGPADQCLRLGLAQAFREAGYDVRKLLLAITQTPAFLHE